MHRSEEIASIIPTFSNEPKLKVSFPPYVKLIKDQNRSITSLHPDLNLPGPCSLHGVSSDLLQAMLLFVASSYSEAIDTPGLLVGISYTHRLHTATVGSTLDKPWFNGLISFSAMPSLEAQLMACVSDCLEM